MSHARDEWETPLELFARLDAEFRFSLDVAASRANRKCARFFDRRTDGLAQPWAGVCWCNPPYGLGLGRWAGKAYLSALEGTTTVCLLPAQVETDWFHRFVLPHAETRWLRGRVNFLRPDGSTGRPRFASFLAIFRPTNHDRSTPPPMEISP